MPGDFSRRTFDSKKHYAGVLMQQGRVQLDADWNEQLDIRQHRTETETIDVVGACGAPKDDAGFGIGVVAGGKDLSISPGRFYVDGLLLELEPSAVPVTYLTQPHYPSPEFTNAATSSPPPGGPPQLVLADGGTYLAYVDAWQREVNARDDAATRETALGGPDTAARLQTIWQVRLLQVQPLSSAAVTCETFFDEWQKRTAATSGTLRARTQAVPDTEDVCKLPPTAGYQRLENQLYRVEVHHGGDRSSATFKWSRDNGTVETSVDAISGSVVTVKDLGPDDVLGFAKGQWVEIVTTDPTPQNPTPQNPLTAPPPLVQIDDIDPATRKITMKVSLAAYQSTAGLKLRRWDQADSAGADGLAMTGNWIDLESGVQVQFAAGLYQHGDYWLIPARTATGDIEWPQDPTQAAPAPLPQPPVGIRHHFCRLAVLTVTGGVPAVKEDCRPRFPSLTHICATDVCFDDTTCDFGNAKTVQDALDALCQRGGGGGCCTLVVTPGPNWHTVFDQIKPQQDAHVCFQVGPYDLAEPVVVRNKGHLTITGCGPGTRITALGREMALSFESCASVNISGLALTSGVTGSAASTQGLNGTLSIRNCGAVDIDSITVRCGAGVNRAASCILVSNKPPSSTDPTAAGSARIRRCELEIGHQQVGILLVNAVRAQVEDNILRAYDKPPALRRSALLSNRGYRSSISRLLVSRASFAAKAAPRALPRAAGPLNVATPVTIGAHQLTFVTEKRLVPALQQLVAALPPTAARSSKTAIRSLRSLADRVVRDEQARARFPAFVTWFGELLAQEDPGIAFQGIVVAGENARDVRISNNTVSNVLQGVHVGISRHAPQDERSADRSADRVCVLNNTLSIYLPLDAARARHGIFVGNCNSLLIENNFLELRGPSDRKVPIEAIRIFGHLGRFMVVRQNHGLDFPTGVLVKPLGENLGSSSTHQWLVEDNIFEHSGAALIAPLNKVHNARNFA